MKTFDQQKFIDNLVRLLNDKRGDFYLLDNLEVVGFKEAPKCVTIYIPCKKSERKVSDGDPAFASNGFLEQMLGIDSIRRCGAECSGHVIHIKTPKKGEGVDYMVWLGKCRVCGKRYIAASTDFLMRVCYHAVFGLWPE